MERCDVCGDRGSDGDPVVEFILEGATATPDPAKTRGHAHIECAQSEGWDE